jgi:hypothetical protein
MFKSADAAGVIRGASQRLPTAHKVRGLWRKDLEWGLRCANRRLAREASTEVPQLLADAVGSHEEVSGSETTHNGVMTDGGEGHRCDAAALRAVGISTELAGRDARAEIGRDGLRGSGEYAFLWAGGWRGDLADERFRHVESRIF